MSIAPLSRREKRKRPLSGGMLFILLVLAFSLAVLIFSYRAFPGAGSGHPGCPALLSGATGGGKGFYEEEMLYPPFTFVESIWIQVSGWMRPGIQ